VRTIAKPKILSLDARSQAFRYGVTHVKNFAAPAEVSLGWPEVVVLLANVRTRAATGVEMEQLELETKTPQLEAAKWPKFAGIAAQKVGSQRTFRPFTRVAVDGSFRSSRHVGWLK
jgi:hypothetical protein